MLIAHRDSAPTRGGYAHRPGGISFIALLQGEPGAIDNFDLSIAISTDDFFTPRHRHNFDQVRFMLQGEFSFDKGRVQRPGQLSYFGEGTYYQQKGVGYSETLLLQCAGASGSGYMGFELLYKKGHELAQRGKFEDGVYTWYDEKGIKHNVDGYQAVWEAVYGRKLEYPEPRYEGAVIINPESYAWVPVAGSPGVAVRELATFHERGLSAGQLRLDAGASHRVTGTPAVNLLFVIEGSGTVDGQPIRRHSAVKVERGESVLVSAAEPLVLQRFRLPCFDQALAVA